MLLVEVYIMKIHTNNIHMRLQVYPKIFFFMPAWVFVLRVTFIVVQIMSYKLDTPQRRKQKAEMFS